MPRRLLDSGQALFDNLIAASPKAATRFGSIYRVSSPLLEYSNTARRSTKLELSASATFCALFRIDRGSQ